MQLRFAKLFIATEALKARNLISLREIIYRQGAENAGNILRALRASAVYLFREAKLFRVFRDSVAIKFSSEAAIISLSIHE